MTTPETPEDLDEEPQPADVLDPDALVVETPVEIHRGLEVDEYDALEQARVVDIDDEY